MHHFPTLVISVILTTSSCSHLTDDFCSQEAPEGYLHSPTLLREENCVLPCHVELSEADSLSASVPHVTWFFESNSETFVSLNNSEFWKKEYNKHYCDKTAYPFPDFREYSGASHFDCIRRAGNSYDCSLENRECFLGTYMCSVALPSAGGPEELLVDEITTRVIVPPCLIIEPPIPLCFQPSADNITAKISSNSPSISKIELTWKPSTKTTNSSCKLKYCIGSRQYRAKMLVFNSMPLESTVEPDYETDWLKVKRREAFYTFSDAQISSEKYFMFKVWNKRRYGTATIPYTNGVTRTKCSGLFYFGNQVKANLSVPPQDTVHLIAPGDSVLIKCSATGQPPPIVTLSHDQDGEIVTVRESISTVQLDLIAYKSEIFYCTAKNSFVNELGMIEQVEISASITVNLISS